MGVLFSKDLTKMAHASKTATHEKYPSLNNLGITKAKYN